MTSIIRCDLQALVPWSRQKIGLAPRDGMTRTTAKLSAAQHGWPTVQL